MIFSPVILIKRILIKKKRCICFPGRGIRNIFLGFPKSHVLYPQFLHLWAKNAEGTFCWHNPPLVHGIILFKKQCITRNATHCNNRDGLLHLTSFWKFQYFGRPTDNPVKHLWWGFYCENSKLLSIFTKKLHRRCSLGF